MFSIIINTIGNKPAPQRKQTFLLLKPFLTFFLANPSLKVPECVRKSPIWVHVSAHLASTGCTRRSWTARCRKRWVPSCGAARLWTTPVLRWSRPSAPSSTDWTSPCQVSTVRGESWRHQFAMNVIIMIYYHSCFWPLRHLLSSLIQGIDCRVLDSLLSPPTVGRACS